MSSIFSKIIDGSIPCYKIAENDKFLSFLDISPLNKGHVLVVPKVETDYIFDIDDFLYAELFLFAKKNALALKNVVSCTKIAISVIGLDVPHTHIHLVPVSNMEDINFSKKRMKFSNDEFIILASKISQEFNKMSQNNEKN